MAARSSVTAPPAWSRNGAVARLGAGEPLTEADEAFFCWINLADRFTHRASIALKRLRAKGILPGLCTSLIGESPGELGGWPFTDQYREVGQVYIKENPLPAPNSSDPKIINNPVIIADRSAAWYLIDYADLVDFTDGFAGVLGDAPTPLIPVEGLRWMCLCERLSSLAQTFCPHKGMPDPETAEEQAQRIIRQRQNAKNATDGSIAKANESRDPILERAIPLRNKHPSWGNGTLAKKVFDMLPPELIEDKKLSVEYVNKVIQWATQNNKLPLSTSHPDYLPTT